jgi:hypothetical protein
MEMLDGGIESPNSNRLKPDPAAVCTLEYATWPDGPEPVFAQRSAPEGKATAKRGSDDRARREVARLAAFIAAVQQRPGMPMK